MGAPVLEASLDELFDSPAMREFLEVFMALSSLGDPFNNKKEKQRNNDAPDQ
jgi:hypothetical protein